MNDSMKDSIHSNWIELVPIDMEVKYQRLYSRKGPGVRVHSTIPPAAPAANAATVPSSSQLLIRQ